MYWRVLFLFLFSTTAFGSHYMYNYGYNQERMRVFMSETGEFEYGNYYLLKGNDTTNKRWINGGLRTEIGLEFLKFLQLDLAHTMISGQNRDCSKENIRGFSLSSGIKMVFTSPAFNFEVGGGVIGSQLDYQNNTISTGMLGYGNYLTGGFNYYVSRQVTFLLQYSRVIQRFDANSPNQDFEKIRSNMNVFNMGVRFFF